MLIVKSQAEADAATRSDMDFLEWVIVILNGVIFAVPIIHSFMEDAFSAIVEKLSSRKFTNADYAQDSESERLPISSSMSFAAADQEFPGRQDSSVAHAELSFSRPNVLKDDLVCSETDVRGTSAMPSERGTHSEQENPDHHQADAQVIANMAAVQAVAQQRKMVEEKIKTVESELAALRSKYASSNEKPAASRATSHLEDSSQS